MGRADMLRTLKPELFANETVGVITVRDILGELEKPGRDPRPDFKVARFNEGVENLSDLKEGMVLEGTVSNVAAFGAFVDLGVHQDGLIHVSQLSNRFVTDAREVVKTGDVVKVRVLEVDLSRQRISLSMKLDASGERSGDRSRGGANRYEQAPRDHRAKGGGGYAQPPSQKSSSRAGDAPAGSAMASAFARLQGLKNKG
jgi:uncharacterized protein